MAASAPAITRRKRVPWPTHYRQRLLHCLVCGSQDLCSSGLCRSCYDAAYHSQLYFGGLKEEVLDRDGHCCRVCTAATSIVHHRKPGQNEAVWLISLCAACHATITRLRVLDRYLLPFLVALWREQHPVAAVEQLRLAWEGAP